MRARSVALLVALLAAWPLPARSAGALGTIAPEVVRTLGTVPSAVVVVAGPLTADQPVAKGDELAARLAAIIAGRLGGAARAHPQSAPLALARAVAGKGGALVFVQPEIAKGELRVTADLYPVMSNGWDRVRTPAPAPHAHAFAKAPLDAEVRTFLPSIVLEQASVHKARHDEGDVLAAACGDLDGDGGMEIALVTRARVAVGRVRGGKFVPFKVAAWSALVPRVGVPAREPLAGAVFGANGGLSVGLSDRGGVRLDANLVPSPLAGIPVPMAIGNACAQPSAEASAFEGDVSACSGAPGIKPSLASPPFKRYDAFAEFDVIGKDGAAVPIWANREPGGKLRLRFGDATLTLEGAGAQIAVGDLDLDGVPEIVTSAESGDDAISVQSWAPFAAPQPPGRAAEPPRARLRLPAPAGVRAFAMCPPEERGAPALVGVVGGELWVLR